MREVLDEHGLRGFPKTSGSRGIHIYVRIVPEHDFKEVRRAALALAREVERRMPGRATSRWWKEEREGVFIDYNQNARDRTVASAYSVRAVADARVSCPLEWEEVPDVEPAELRLDTVPARLRERGDPSAAIDEHPGTLEALLELAARDEREGLGDAPWPPHFRKQKRRAAPRRASRAARRAPMQRMSRTREPAAAAAAQAPAGALAQGAAGGRGLRLRDQARRLSLPGVRRRRGGVPAVAHGQAARALLPRAGAPAGRYVLDGEIVVRGERRPRGLRRARPAHPPGRLADRAPVRRDARRLRRLRPARPRGRVAARAAARPSAARRSRSCSRERRSPARRSS